VLEAPFSIALASRSHSRASEVEPDGSPMGMSTMTARQSTVFEMQPVKSAAWIS